MTNTQQNAPARGQLRVSYVKPGSRPPASGPGELVEIQDNQVAFDVETPTQISYAAEQVAGYWIASKSGTQILSGEQPMVVDVPVQPAGAVRGQVWNADGSLGVNCDVVLLACKSHEVGGIRDTSSQPQGQFLFGGIPLGGEYRLLARYLLQGWGAVTLSEPFSLDEQNPIREIDLHLPTGRDHLVRAVDSAGQPVSGAAVGLRFSVSYGDGSHTMSARQETDQDGLARFCHVNVDLPGNVEVCVSPSANLRGRQVTADWRSSPQTVTLEPGVLAHGVLAEASTGRRVPHAELMLIPRDYQTATYRESIYGHTDERGEFRFDSLEPLEYQVSVNGAVHPDVKIVPLPNGSHQFQYPKEYRLFLRGGDPAALRIAVQLLPDSQLKTVAVP